MGDLGDGSSSDGEGWLQRFEGDQDSEPDDSRIADVRDSIRLPPDECFVYTSTSEPQLSVSVRCSALAGIGHQLWPATFLLTSIIEDRHATLKGYWQGKRVLELGSGCGLVGLLAAALGAHVVLTDLPSVLDLLLQNAAANMDAIAGAGGRIDVKELTWGQPVLPAGWEAPDIVLAADLVYHRNLYEPLLQTLQQFGPDTHIFVANVRRWKHGESNFFKPARKVFALQDLTPTIPLDGSQLQGMQSSNCLRLYQFTRKN